MNPAQLLAIATLIADLRIELDLARAEVARLTADNARLSADANTRGRSRTAAK